MTDVIAKPRRALFAPLLIWLLAVACASDPPTAAPADGDLPFAFGPDSDEPGPEPDDSPTTSESTTTSSTTTTATTTTAPKTTQASAPTVPLARLELDLEPIARLDRPVALEQRPNSNQLFVAEKGGRVQNISTGEVALDISDQVSSGNEQGLLGLVFSPDGSHLYVNFTDNAGDSFVHRYDMDGTVADETTAVQTIAVSQERSNHNGGHLAFGPDGYLYIGFGDGGGGGDPGGNGQNPTTPLGAMLRIEPTDDGHSIPPDNPFASGDGGAPEVYMTGLRNPWRYSFDSANGDLWIGDVGQDRFEEVSVARAGSLAGTNFGWNDVEGFELYRDGVASTGHTPPFAAYSQTDGRCSITGGHVYRGRAIPSLVGTYVFGDFCNGEILGLDADGNGTIVQLQIPRVQQLASFGVDSAGEMYAISLGGMIYRITG